MNMNTAIAIHKSLIIFLCLATIYFEIRVIKISNLHWTAWLVILLSLYWGGLYLYSLVINFIGIQTNLQIWVRSGITATMLLFCVKAIRVVRAYERKR